MRFARAQAGWDDLSELDPYWAILSDSRKRHGGWELEEFMRSGHEEVGALLARAAELGHPLERRKALDFDCGVGRVSQALASHFDECVGMDISERMIERARDALGQVGNCTFVVSGDVGLRGLANDEFDLVYPGLRPSSAPGATTRAATPESHPDAAQSPAKAARVCGA